MKLLISVLVICLTQTSVLGQVDVNVVEAPTRLADETEAEFRKRRESVLREDAAQKLDDAIVVAAGVPLLSQNSPELQTVQTFYRAYPSLITHFYQHPPENKAVLKIVNGAIERRKLILKTCVAASPLRDTKRAEMLRAECEWEDKLCTALDELYTPKEMDALCSSTKLLKGTWITSKALYLRCGNMSNEDFAYLRKCKLSHAKKFLKMLADSSYSMDPKSLPRPLARLTVSQFETVLHLFRDIKPNQTIDDFWDGLSPSQQRGVLTSVPSLSGRFAAPQGPGVSSE